MALTELKNFSKMIPICSMIVLQAPFLETFLLLLYQKDLFRKVVDKIYISYNSFLFVVIRNQ